MSEESKLQTHRGSGVCALVVVLALLISGIPAARAVVIQGRVVDADGAPLQYVRIRVTDKHAVPYSSTVFSSADGTFALNYKRATAGGIDINAFRIGWKETGRTTTATRVGLSVKVTMQRIANVADQVPASAWLKGDPSSQGYRMTTLQCSNCHQLGAYRVRKFAASMAHLSLAGRIAGWTGMVQFMRFMTMRLGPGQPPVFGLKVGTPAYTAVLKPDTSLFAPRDMAIIIPYLARNYPVDFNCYTDYNDIERLGSYGVNAKTRIDEFELPTFGWTREVAIAPGSDKVWFVETNKDRVGALDPKDGSVKWYPIPGKGPQGPHTMNADASGHIWVGLEDSYHIGRLDTRTGKWRIYSPPPDTNFGITHDFAFDSNRHITPDAKGRIYITALGANELWGINADTGKGQAFRMPLPQGETNFHALIYGAAIDPKHNRVWYAQLDGNVGSFDTEHDVPEYIIPFRRGDGPRRLAIAKDGTLWISLFGSSQLVEIDPNAAIELGRWQIPDRGAGPYGITLDKRRNAIWAATSNSDRIYRFDIATKKWTQYPLPRKETYLRMIELDPVTDDVWTTYASLPIGKRNPAIYGTEHANNMIVRLHPGN